MKSIAAVSFSFVLMSGSGISATSASAQIRQTPAAVDSVAVVAVASRFHDALRSGDSATVARLLAPGLRVLEGGEVETRNEYLAHHLGADMEFARAVQEQRKLQAVVIKGQVAWLVSTSMAKGTFRSRDINSIGAELMILSRGGDGWRIEAVQWSSQRAPTAQ